MEAERQGAGPFALLDTDPQSSLAAWWNGLAISSGTARPTKITADAATALSQHGTVAPMTVHQRVDFAVSMIDGLTVGELGPNRTQPMRLPNYGIMQIRA